MRYEHACKDRAGCGIRCAVAGARGAGVSRGAWRGPKRRVSFAEREARRDYVQGVLILVALLGLYVLAALIDNTIG